MKRHLLLAAILFLAIPSAGIQASNSVVIESKIIQSGQTGVTIGVYITNDVSLGSFTMPLEFRSISGGAFTADTLFVQMSGRILLSGLSDGPIRRFFDNPSANTCSGPVSNSFSTSTGASNRNMFDSPDALLWVGANFFGTCLSPGSDGVPSSGTPSLLIGCNLNSSPGTFEIDTCCVAPGNHLFFGTCDNSTSITPVFTKSQITLVSQVTEVAIESRSVLTGSSNVQLSVHIGNTVDCGELVLPLVARSLTGGAFWTNVPTELDTLPWHGRLTNALTSNRIFDISLVDGVSPDQVLLAAEEGGGSCLVAGPPQSMITLEFDVNSSPGTFEIDTVLIAPNHILATLVCGSNVTIPTTFSKGVIEILPPADTTFEVVSLLNSDSSVFSIALEDFDADENLDIVLVGNGPSPIVFFGDGSGGTSGWVLLGNNALGGNGSVAVANLNKDRFPDIIEIDRGSIETHLNNGDRTFQPPVSELQGGIVSSLVAGHINNDEYVDLVADFNIYLGDGDGTFTPVVPAQLDYGIITVALADMNNDGIQDVVAGSSAALIYLGSGDGHFTFSDSVHIGNSWGVQASSAGNLVDFDEDGDADFVLTNPRSGVGDVFSDVHIVFGDGQGGIDSAIVLPIDGTCIPARVLDYNLDNHLDIVTGCSSQERIRVLLGDGTGGFSPGPVISTIPWRPISLSVGDLREDGRWDFVIGDMSLSAASLMSTQTPQPVLDSQMVTRGINHVEVGVINPLQLSADVLGVRIAGARVGSRDIDSNAVIDREISDLNLLAGLYTIRVWRIPNSPPDNYTLGVGIDAHLERTLARNAALPAPGDTFEFDFPIGPGLETVPQTGGYASSNQPTFDWSQVAGSKKRTVRYSFELDDNWDFQSPLIVDTTITLATYTPTAPLLSDSLYYWRFREFDGTSWSSYSSVYAVNTPPPCNCNCHGDPGGFCDGFTNILDVAQAVNVAFRNAAPILDPNINCLYQTTDVNCDTTTTVIDVVKIVNVAFRNSNRMTEFCDPCP